MVKWLRCNNNIYAISSLYTTTPGGGGKSTVDGGFGSIVVTSCGFVDPFGIGEINGGILFICSKDTESLMRLALVDLKLPQPHSQNFQGDSNGSMQVFLDKEVEYVVGSENLHKYVNNQKDVVVLYDYL